MLVLMSAKLMQLKCKRLITLHLRSTAPNKNKTNLDENSKFVLFFTRDYFGVINHIMTLNGHNCFNKISHHFTSNNAPFNLTKSYGHYKKL